LKKQLDAARGTQGSMRNMEYEIREGWLKILLSGDVTSELTRQIKNEIETLLDNSSPRPIVVCDMARVRFLDSSGIGMLVFLHNKLRQKVGRLYLYQPSVAVRKTLDLVQLLSFFELIDDEMEFLGQFP